MGWSLRQKGPYVVLGQVRLPLLHRCSRTAISQTQHNILFASSRPGKPDKAGFPHSDPFEFSSRTRQSTRKLTVLACFALIQQAVVEVGVNLSAPPQEQQDAPSSHRATTRDNHESTSELYRILPPAVCAQPVRLEESERVFELHGLIV
ncbi:hypothetical protein PoB_000574100 [Plakobranchus ocellatus]|uniref:Uncharacterized protein n=1 Tax=Plakobranchus ocellatus TaxID=259542 RepID=A0AAV3XW76_9GAST|nr:hypothetical protein PoB_000574100 [Plakobranchus ocellatus]